MVFTEIVTNMDNCYTIMWYNNDIDHDHNTETTTDGTKHINERASTVFRLKIIDIEHFFCRC